MMLALKIAEVWGLVSIVVTALWIAAHGGVRSDR